MINHIFVPNNLIEMLVDINNLVILWLPIMRTNNIHWTSSEYVKQYKFSYNCCQLRWHFYVNFTCFHNSRPHFLVCVLCVCVCVRVLVYVTLPTYALNNRTRARARTHIHTPIYIYIYMSTIVQFAISYSLNFHRSVQLQECCTSVFSRLCVHRDASSVCVHDKIACSGGVVVRAVGLPWWLRWWLLPKYVWT